MCFNSVQLPSPTPSTAVYSLGTTPEWGLIQSSGKKKKKAGIKTKSVFVGDIASLAGSL